MESENGEDESDMEFDGLEGTYNLSSTYFDIFDNLMRKYLADLNTKDELRMELARELGKQSIFLYQRLNLLEQKAAKEFEDKHLAAKISNCLVLYDKSAEADVRAKNRALMQGNYEFKFGSTTVNMTEKLSKVSSEPTAFHLYKRRDLAAKIDKLAINQLRMAKLIYNITQGARKDR